MAQFPPGRYYIGDLCYVVGGGDWDMICDLLLQKTATEGQFTTADGNRFAIYFTTHGDGIYYDQENNAYPVDSGTLGIISIDDTALVNTLVDYIQSKGLGRIVEFTEPFDTGKGGPWTRPDSVILFGNVAIDTDPVPEWDNEDDGQPDEAQEWEDYDQDF